MRALHELHLPLDVPSNSGRRRDLGLLGPCLLVFGCRQFLSIGQVVDGDGQEHVEECIVAKQSEDDEVKAVGDLIVLGLDAIVHHLGVKSYLNITFESPIGICMLYLHSSLLP